MDLVVLAAEAELPVPPIAIGGIGFALLLALLALTLVFGKGRPHS